MNTTPSPATTGGVLQVMEDAAHAACDCGANPDNRWPHHDECALYRGDAPNFDIPVAAPAGGGDELPGYVKTALAACEPHHAQTIRDFIESRRLASTGSAPPNRSSETTSAPRAWRPIKVAPDQKEPSPVVLLCDEFGNRWTDVYPGECWRSNGCGSPPVYWQPLPAAPTQEPPKGDDADFYDYPSKYDDTTQ